MYNIILFIISAHCSFEFFKAGRILIGCQSFYRSSARKKIVLKVITMIYCFSVVCYSFIIGTIFRTSSSLSL